MYLDWNITALDSFLSVAVFDNFSVCHYGDSSGVCHCDDIFYMSLFVTVSGYVTVVIVPLYVIVMAVSICHWLCQLSE